MLFRSRSVLEKTGYEVVTADNGKEAIDILSRNDGDFDVIVSDIEMPLVNGFQFALAVKKEPNLASIPMLAISSRADNAYVSEGKKAGFDMYLEKFKPNILVDSLADLISRKREAA